MNVHTGGGGDNDDDDDDARFKHRLRLIKRFKAANVFSRLEKSSLRHQFVVAVDDAILVRVSGRF